MASAQACIQARPLRWGWLVVAIATTTALLGVLLSVRTLMPTSQHHGSGSFTIGDDVPTSFGIVAVEFVRSVDGVTHRALAGATHGVSGLVGDGKQQIQVAVALTNRGKQPMTYSVRQFQLRATVKGKTSLLPATAGDLPDGRILPDAGIEGHLDFTLPAADATMSLVFHDAGRSAPVVIGLGRITATVPGSVHTHG
ncbi:MAG: hypothetical protein QOG98_1124 [Pseudonocardiales bacterium]|jgi:hypothetical protein|nr:hypothetical protein [Pseudonocardiales bacterium]